MSVLVAAPASGAGKTTVTLALLAWLHRRGLRTRSFKVGPDYIDPMFHSAITTQPCINLDPFLSDENFVQRTFAFHCQGQEATVIEGVMGLFDGRIGEGDRSSSAHVARLLGVPVVLVLDAARCGYSVAALLHGFTHFDPRLVIAGVIFNRVGSERHEQVLLEAAASQNVPVLGMLPRDAGVHLAERHLGLVAVEELPDFQHLADRLAHLADRCLDWERLLPLIAVADRPCAPRWDIHESFAVRIGVARDRAFSFYYQDNLDLLVHLGARLVAFSPLADEWPDCDGYLLGGGYPELFARHLAGSARFWAGLAGAVRRGQPLYAECGGLMVLTEAIETPTGEMVPMAGILPARCRMAAKSCLGYREAEALRASCAVEAGWHLRGHEFHRSRLQSASPRPLFRLQDAGLEGWSEGHLHASYLHLHWGARPEIARRFLAGCPA